MTVEAMILGSVLLVIVVFFPRGLVGEASTLARRFRAWLSEEEPGESPSQEEVEG